MSIMPKRPVPDRIRSFEEVALGLPEDVAIKEASRCLQCKSPRCVAGCPVQVDIPAFIKLVKEGRFREAIKKIKEKNSLPAICGRVCPQEEQCQGVCVLGLKGAPCNIGALERFVADWELEEGFDTPATRPATGFMVAVVGSGPAGLTAAADLAKMGHEVCVFEALHKPGGVLMYGIPEFRLPKRIVEAEVSYVKSLGVRLELNRVIGKSDTVEELLEEYDAVFIGTGAGLPNFLGIPGENLCGVYSANEFLIRSNLMRAYEFPKYDTPVKIGERVAVIGAGNVAMDAARTALRLGAGEVHIVYRRTEREMPARADEVVNAKEEGVVFDFLTNPVAFHGDGKGWVSKMECVRMRLGEADESGRGRPVPVADSNFLMDVDIVIVAIGVSPNPLIPKSMPSLAIGTHGEVKVNPLTCETNIRGIFAGGDIATGSATVISAMGAGKRAATSIDRYISSGEGSTHRL
ncbi:MAG: NADPH-dependent glutamate synthase [Candidatus Bathyarchaeia archaeon]